MRRAAADKIPVGTWGASPAAPTYFIPVEFMPQPAPIQGTIRCRVRISAGGTQLRLRLSNETGGQPLNIGAATVGIATKAGAGIRKGFLRVVRFSRQTSACILPGSAAVSDAVELTVADHQDLIISLYLPDAFVPAQGGDTHKASLSRGPDTTMRHRWPKAASLAVRPIVSGITVVPTRPTRVVVTLGDSITDGSTDASGCLPFAFRGWPEILSKRLRARAATLSRRSSAQYAYSVVNAGIGGNRVLGDFIGAHALARLDRDVFAVPAATHLIVSEGINDIGIGGRTIAGVTLPMVKADELIAGYLQIIARAREQGIKVIGATLPPFRDAFYFLEEKEVVRQAVNAWIRRSRAFDGLIDFDRVLRDARDPGRLRADFDTGDHLHPNAAAFQAMGEVIDLDLFETA